MTIVKETQGTESSQMANGLIPMSSPVPGTVESTK